MMGSGAGVSAVKKNDVMISSFSFCLPRILEAQRRLPGIGDIFVFPFVI
jgi:hypothetical protein